MRIYSAMFLILAPAFVLGQGAHDDSISALVKKLGSPSFQERNTAAEMLKLRPEAAPALREALRTTDTELRKRAADILDYYDRAPLRELQSAADQGRIDHAIKLIAAWPKEKHEDEVWQIVTKMGRSLATLHEMQGGPAIGFANSRWYDIAKPYVVSEKRITEAIKVPQDLPEGRFLFLRGAEADLDFGRSKKKGTDIKAIGAIVTSGSVRSRTVPLGVHAILADGDVELDGTFSYLTIVSSGDVNLKECTLNQSLVIARGKVLCGNNNYSQCRMIAGKSVQNKSGLAQSKVTEDESNPLGFVRWSPMPNVKKKSEVK
jgi:hypothetical protein